MSSLQVLCSGLPLRPLPENRGRQAGVPHAPVRTPGLSLVEKQLALRNALRYFPADVQELLAPEFAQELQLYGHIYMYRFCPDIEMRAYPVEQYPCQTKAAAAIMHMIMNNLDPAVAQFPQELVTYGGNGQVFSNWAQFWLTMFYLSKMTEEQTLVMYSGHPLGLFPSSRSAPRLIITNGMVIPNYSSRMEYEKLFALGVTMYGQMTAGSYCYIGPQGIVHGTVLTVLNAARRYLGIEDLAGKVFVTSGLGGMSGAQAKAAVIVGCIGVIAEVDKAALEKRHKQGWLMEVTDSLDRCIQRLRVLQLGLQQAPGWAGLPAALGLCVLSYLVDLAPLGEGRCPAPWGFSRPLPVSAGAPVLLLCPSREARKRKEALSLGYHGNVVALWERLVHELDTTGECLVDLGSDQTSCHNPFNGGYYPVQLSFTEAQSLMASNPAVFKDLVQESLRRQVSAINKLAKEKFFFWDYGNAFLLEAQRAGADVEKKGAGRTEFRYPSYVQHIMGDIFSQGFGPFRWVCTSGDPQDLAVTDELATSVLEEAIANGVKASVKLQYMDNIRWIREAARHQLVVGSQARILYSDQKGRVAIAVAINQAIACRRIKAPVVLSRDHHDVSGTDSPFRETSNIYDGSAFCADMAVQNFVGDACRGATWVALHNGGGVGWGEVINGGFGLVLDGTPEAEQRARLMLSWDVSNGVARRCWSGNQKAYEIICQTMQENSSLVVTLPHEVEDERVLQQALQL
ncbi:PREDICTED: urocanate hydratase isoform X1 [Mandrillus leucophaeus]|uniref:urocanate hydratase isoform X1 n=1 Tax=Mandrillus leucophaeus TaxID=9568 RepID=UPI0005F3A382|nr:PREDICTED: urocanate hydratase isoform X1 [Mandrillus leucophaeus]